MKHLMLTFTLAATLSAGLYAQEPQAIQAPGPQQQAMQKQLSPADRAKKDAAQAEQKLALSSDQKTKWEAAALEQATANAGIKEKMQGCTTPQERKDYHAQLRQNYQKYKSTVTALLTPEQKTKYEQMQKERHKGHYRGMPGDRPAQEPQPVKPE